MKKPGKGKREDKLKGGVGRDHTSKGGGALVANVVHVQVQL
jgi:hypothetical protein